METSKPGFGLLATSSGSSTIYINNIVISVLSSIRISFTLTLLPEIHHR